MSREPLSLRVRNQVTNPTEPRAGWCCLGSKPAKRLGRGMADACEVTSSVNNNPGMNPLAARSVGLDA